MRRMEVWHFYAGDMRAHVRLRLGAGTAQVIKMGRMCRRPDSTSGAGAAGSGRGEDCSRVGLKGPLSEKTKAGKRRLKPGPLCGYALLGCTVSQPWEELVDEARVARRTLREFPAHAEFDRALTRDFEGCRRGHGLSARVCPGKDRKIIRSRAFAEKESWRASLCRPIRKKWFQGGYRRRSRIPEPNADDAGNRHPRCGGHRAHCC